MTPTKENHPRLFIWGLPQQGRHPASLAFDRDSKAGRGGKADRGKSGRHVCRHLGQLGVGCQGGILCSSLGSTLDSLWLVLVRVRTGKWAAGCHHQVLTVWAGCYKGHRSESYSYVWSGHCAYSVYLCLPQAHVPICIPTCCLPAYSVCLYLIKQYTHICTP